jgi:hypothetical protein
MSSRALGALAIATLAISMLVPVVTPSLASVARADDPPTAFIDGHVTFADGSPAAGAGLLSCTTDTGLCLAAATNEFGDYSFEGLVDRNQNLQVIAPGLSDGYRPVANFTLTGAGATYDIVLGGGSVSGVVTHVGTGAPASGVGVIACGPIEARANGYGGLNSCVGVATEPDGSYDLSFLPDGTHEMSIQLGARYIRVGEVSTSGTAQNFDFFVPAAVISGYVRDADGNILLNVMASACSAAGWGCFVDQADETGRFRFELLAADGYLLSAADADGGQLPGEAALVNVADGEIVEHDIIVDSAPEESPESLFVSNSSGGADDISGTITGSFDCGTASHLDAEILGNAYGPYPGTFTETIDADIVDGLVTGFDVTFEVLSGATTISGEAHYAGGVSDGACSSFFDPDENVTIYRFSAGFGGGGHAALPLQYSATYVTDGVSRVEEGWLSAGINLYCLGSATFTDNCDVATGGLRFIEPVASGDAGEASTEPATDDSPIAVSIDNPSGGSVTITRLSGAQPPVSSYALLGDSYAIHADLPATVDDPIQLTFVIHSSALFNPETGELLDTEAMTVVRDGVLAADCAGTAMVAQPDPCVRSRSVDGAGNVSLLVLTSHASVWTAAYRTALSPCAATQASVATLWEMSQHADLKQAKVLRRAIDALTGSLTARWWLDDSRLDPKTGNKVFDQYSQAVKELTKKELNGLQGVGAVIEAIVAAARRLAQSAVDDAVAAGGNAKDVGAAQAALIKGDAANGNAKYEVAIDSYKAAWDKAQKSLK